jgi:hypothetical protein
MFLVFAGKIFMEQNGRFCFTLISGDKNQEKRKKKKPKPLAKL